jgi:hypothetical protein
MPDEEITPAAEPAPAPDTTAAEPVTLDTDPGTPAPETALPGTPAPETASDPYSEYGGRDTVAAAIKLHQATQSPDGVVQLFMEAGQALGLGVKDMERLFGEGTPEPPAPEDLERPLSVKEFQEALAKQREEQVTQAQAQQRSIAEAAVQKTTTELGLKANDPTTKLVLEMGDKYLNGDLSPENITNAVKRGYADYQAMIVREAEAYLSRKQQQAASVPGAPSGASAPSAPPPKEPADIQEAIRMARKRMAL